MKVFIPKEEFEKDYLPSFQKGGELEIKKLTGEYAKGIPSNMEQNAVSELEAGEYKMTPDGNVKEIIGKKHSEGGEKFTEQETPNGTIVVSDYLKVGSNLAKKYSEDLGIKVKASDTYATVIDKYSSKIGLKPLVEEQEKLIKKIEAQKELKGNDEAVTTTQALNLDLLGEKLYENETKKLELEKDRAQVLRSVYQDQEQSKEPSSKMKFGGQLSYHQAGSEVKYNISSPFFTYSPFAKEVYGKQKFVNTTGNLSGDLNNLEGAVNRTKVQYGTLPYTLSTSGLYDGSVFNPTKTKGFQASYDKYTDAVTSEIDYNPFLSAEEKTKMKEIALKQKLSFSKTNPKLKGDYDGVDGEETSTRMGYKLPYLTKKDFDKYGEKLKFLGDALDEKGNIKEEYKDLEEGTKQRILGSFKRQGKNAFDIGLSYVSTDAKKDEGKGKTTTEGSDYSSKEPNRTGFKLFPSQQPMFPESLELPGLRSINPRYVEAPQMSAEQALLENRRSTAAYMDDYQNRSDSQAAAMAAQLQANEMGQNNRAIFETNRANIAGKFQQDVINAQSAYNADVLNNQYTDSYEGKVAKAKTLTDANIRNYFNQLQKINLSNYNAIENLNLLNQMYDNYGYNGNEVVQTNSDKLVTKKSRFGGKI